MKIESSRLSTLLWPKGADSDLYQLARRAISAQEGQVPKILSTEPDMSDFFEENPDGTLYYPVFFGSTGWWGELLGIDAKVVKKITISADCQLMAISKDSEIPNHNGRYSLFAAEIQPSSQFFKKMNSSIATSLDMLATDSGSILALFAGKNQSKFVNMLESTGNSYLGCIGTY